MDYSIKEAMNAGFNLKYFDHSKEIAGFSLSKGSVSKEACIALRNLLTNNIELEKIYALGNHINSRLDKDSIFFCDDVGERMNSNFLKIDKEPKVKLTEVKKYYKKLNNNIQKSQDDEFADYISRR